MGIDYCAVRESVIARYPFMGATTAELNFLFGPSRSPLETVATAVFTGRVEPANLH